MRCRIIGRLTVMSILMLGLTACDPAPEVPAASAAPAPGSAAATTTDIYSDALQVPGRLPRDLDRDARRMPHEVARFMGVEPGDRVLDLFAGGGYYSEYLANLVGPSGWVHAHNNAAYVAYQAEEIELRFSGDRLGNLSLLQRELSALEFGQQRYDFVFMVLAYHDVYYIDEPSWPEVDSPALLAELYTALVPGGVLAVVDHAAAVGDGRMRAQDLHRIEQSALIEDMQAAGFVLEAESDLLRNRDDTGERVAGRADAPFDDHSVSVFEPSIRGCSDRFVLRFRKPE